MGSKFQEVNHPEADDAGAEVSDEAVDQACLYAAGVLETEERVRHEALMEQDPRLMALTTGLLETVTATVLETLPPGQRPSPALKTRVGGVLEARSELDLMAKSYVEGPAESIVLTDAVGSIQWVSPSFTAMCGFALEELRGRKPGSILQGRLTDVTGVSRIREALTRGQACSEELVNYHKDGHPYWVAIAINPLRGADGQLRGFLAIEQELTDKPISVEV